MGGGQVRRANDAPCGFFPKKSDLEKAAHPERVLRELFAIIPNG